MLKGDPPNNHTKQRGPHEIPDLVLRVPNLTDHTGEAELNTAMYALHRRESTFLSVAEI